MGVGVGQDSVSPPVKWKGGAWKILTSPLKSRIPCRHCSKQTGAPFGDLSSERSEASDFSTPVAWICETDSRMFCKSAGVVEKIWAGRQMCHLDLRPPLPAGPLQGLSFYDCKMGTIVPPQRAGKGAGRSLYVAPSKCKLMWPPWVSHMRSDQLTRPSSCVSVPLTQKAAVKGRS